MHAPYTVRACGPSYHLMTPAGLYSLSTLSDPATGADEYCDKYGASPDEALPAAACAQAFGEARGVRVGGFT